MNYTYSHASFSRDRQYRYHLTRMWSNGELGRGQPSDKQSWPPYVLFGLLNPSTADGSSDDPTVRKCVGFAQRWGFEHCVLVNLTPRVATAPALLLKRIVSQNDIAALGSNASHIEYLLKHRACKKVVYGWGANGKRLIARLTSAGPKREHMPLLAAWDANAGFCFGWTASGDPKHPLYLPYTSNLSRPYPDAPPHA